MLLRLFLMPAQRILLLSVGYGQGHHSAAYAMAEEFESRGWDVRVEDPCAEGRPKLFRLTQNFYRLCVRRMPWLWGVAYACTDTADWSLWYHSASLRACAACIRRMLREWNPQLVVCTYPLYAYMLDTFRARGEISVPYAVLVTDAQEISRPWLRSRAPMVIVPDEESQRIVCERYALETSRVVVGGFPVRRAFCPNAERCIPSADDVRLVYGAYRATEGVCDDVRALFRSLPGVSMVLLGGSRAPVLREHLADVLATGRLQIIDATERMHELFSWGHFYIGKAGAATMFEAYSSELPVLVNYTLPGQEQGNLQLLLQDGAGVHVECTGHLVQTVVHLLDEDAAGWLRLCHAMRSANRSGAAARIVDMLQDLV